MRVGMRRMPWWGISGACALLVLALGAVAAYFSTKKWWRNQAKSKNMKHRQEGHVNNSVDNLKAEKDHQHAEDEIEEFLLNSEE